MGTLTRITQQPKVMDPGCESLCMVVGQIAAGHAINEILDFGVILAATHGDKPSAQIRSEDVSSRSIHDGRVPKLTTRESWAARCRDKAKQVHAGWPVERPI